MAIVEISKDALFIRMERNRKKKYWPQQEKISLTRRGKYDRRA